VRIVDPTTKEEAVQLVHILTVPQDKPLLFRRQMPVDPEEIMRRLQSADEVLIFSHQKGEVDEMFLTVFGGKKVDVVQGTSSSLETIDADGMACFSRGTGEKDAYVFWTLDHK